MHPYSLDKGETSEATPTVGRELSVDLFLGAMSLGKSVVRYQFQTWKGSRSPESRITHPRSKVGWHPLWDVATKDDLIVFQRRSDATDHFRMILVKPDTPEHREIVARVHGRRWGPLYADNPPVTQADLITAQDAIDVLAQRSFQVVLPNVRRTETFQNRIARATVHSGWGRSTSRTS